MLSCAVELLTSYIHGAYYVPCMRSIRFAVLASLFVALMTGAALAQSQDDSIVVIEVSGPLDQRALDYVTRSLETESTHLFVVKVDSPGVSSGDLKSVFDAMATADAPVVSWIGPFGAEAYGGSALIANHADLRFAAPGTRIGYLEPAVQRDGGGVFVLAGVDTDTLSTLNDGVVTLTLEDSEIPGFVDGLEPALGQLIVSLDGTTVDRGDQAWELSTARTETIEGQEFLVPTRNVRFVKPGLMDQILRISSRPETAFLFLLVGLAFAAFEFYAAGRGLMAGVAGASLVLSGYGMATLPMWWPAVVITFAGLGILVWGFSENKVDWRSVLGSILLLIGGFTFTTSAPAYPPSPWIVVLAVAVSVVFIWYSLTTVVRGRFATPTVGREELLGKRCLAVSDLDPEGTVLLDEVRWFATADRGVVIGAGAVVEVVGITGLVLEVDPVVTRGREEI